MKRYYISHPFTGNEERNKADADRIRAALKEAHPDICFMNPLGMFGNKDTDYCTALADALELLSTCNAVIFCQGWENSCGCRAEKAFAMQQGIKVMYLEDFPEVAHRMTDDAVKEDLAKALKEEIIRQENGIKAACAAIVAKTSRRKIFDFNNLQNRGMRRAAVRHNKSPVSDSDNMSLRGGSTD